MSETEAAKLTASDGQPEDQLGASIAVSADATLVVSGGKPPMFRATLAKARLMYFSNPPAAGAARSMRSPN